MYSNHMFFIVISFYKQIFRLFCGSTLPFSLLFYYSRISIEPCSLGPADLLFFK